MTDPIEPPRPRDYALQAELDSLRQQEREGHLTPNEQRRAEHLEHRLKVDEHGADLTQRKDDDWAADRKDDDYRSRHHR